jgi:ABC-type uncharacterized transport system permease subunit
MPALTLALLAVLAYLAATLLLARALRANEGGTRAGLALALPAALVHLVVHGMSWTQGAAPPMHFFAALSLVGVGMALLTAVAGGWQRLEALGVVVFPLAAATLLLYVAMGQDAGTVLTDWRIALHAWLALLAYAALAVGALLAIMLWLQERALRRRQLGQLMRLLPPLTQLEILLFRTIGAGFALLTLALLSGGLFVQDLFAQHLAHKTVLSIMAWLVFALLLLGRWRLGWRGRRAVRLTLGAMSLLLLAFFGSKFVLELVLQRGAA